MIVPKYVKDLMKRSNYVYMDKWAKHTDYAVGYTIEIHKSTEYAYVDTLKKEVEQLQRFIIRNGGEMKILYIPNTTHYRDQTAVITIFDPVMRHLEEFIKDKK